MAQGRSPSRPKSKCSIAIRVSISVWNGGIPVLSQKPHAALTRAEKPNGSPRPAMTPHSSFLCTVISNHEAARQIFVDFGLVGETIAETP